MTGDDLAAAKASGWKVETAPKSAAPLRPRLALAARPMITGTPTPWDIVRWLQDQGIVPLPCRPKSKRPIKQISRRDIYGDHAPPGDSFHEATPERMAAVKAWWSNADFHQQATVRDESISIDLNPGWNSGQQLAVIDIDAAGLREAIENAPALVQCPVITGKKGAKVLAFLFS